MQVVPRQIHALGDLGEQQDVAIHRLDQVDVAGVPTPREVPSSNTHDCSLAGASPGGMTFANGRMRRP
jgi:hypothetical protein